MRELTPEMRRNFKRLSQKFEKRDYSIKLNKALSMIEKCRSEGSKYGPTKATATPFELICYWFSHEHIELFLEDDACLFLFRTYIGEAVTQWDKAYVAAKNKRPLTRDERALRVQEYTKTVENL